MSEARSGDYFLSPHQQMLSAGRPTFHSLNLIQPQYNLNRSKV